MWLDHQSCSSSALGLGCGYWPWERLVKFYDEGGSYGLLKLLSDHCSIFFSLNLIDYDFSVFCLHLCVAPVIAVILFFRFISSAFFFCFYTNCFSLSASVHSLLMSILLQPSAVLLAIPSQFDWRVLKFYLFKVPSLLGLVWSFCPKAK